MNSAYNFPASRVHIFWKGIENDAFWRNCYKRIQFFVARESIMGVSIVDICFAPCMKNRTFSELCSQRMEGSRRCGSFTAASTGIPINHLLVFFSLHPEFQYVKDRQSFLSRPLSTAFHVRALIGLCNASAVARTLASKSPFLVFHWFENRGASKQYPASRILSLALVDCHVTKSPRDYELASRNEKRGATIDSSV